MDLTIRLIACVVVLCFGSVYAGTRHPIVQVTAPVGWSVWYDRDNPSGTGDWECPKCFPKNTICRGKTITNVQCKRLRTGTIFTHATANQMPNIFQHRCTVANGLVCVNKDNIKAGKPYCEDYAIRFYCDNKIKCKMSQWYDRDRPSGTGDWEHLSALRKDGYKICPGQSIKGAECWGKKTRRVFTQATAHLMPNVLRVPCTPSGGLVCVTVDQTGTPCEDYKIRFCCG